jgi:hypothetical protein
MSTDGGKSLSSRVYEKILKPVLNSPKPPPIVITFSSSQTRLAILRHKRNNLPTPSDDEKRGGIKNYILAEYLTSPTFRMLKLLHADERISKAWSTEGRLKFILCSDPNTIHRVKSVFLPIKKIIPSSNSQHNSVLLNFKFCDVFFSYDPIVKHTTMCVENF